MDYSTEELIARQNRQWEHNLRVFYVIAVVLLTLSFLALMTVHSEGAEVIVKRETLADCLKPANLQGGLKDSYEGLKQAGYDVKVVCKEKQKPLTAEQLKALESLR